jgi:hypothetical protein
VLPIRVSGTVEALAGGGGVFARCAGSMLSSSLSSLEADVDEAGQGYASATNAPHDDLHKDIVDSISLPPQAIPLPRGREPPSSPVAPSFLPEHDKIRAVGLLTHLLHCY